MPIRWTVSMECSQIRPLHTSPFPLSALVGVHCRARKNANCPNSFIMQHKFLAKIGPLDGGSKEWYVSFQKKHRTEAVRDGALCSVVLRPPKGFCFLSLQCVTVTKELAVSLQCCKMKPGYVSQWKCESGVGSTICLSVEFFVLLFVVSKLSSLVVQFLECLVLPVKLFNNASMSCCLATICFTSSP